MKRTILHSCVAALFVSLLGVCDAGETGKTKKTARVAGQKARTDKAVTGAESSVLTGSHLKSTYQRRGQITDGLSQVVVLDRQAIERSGASDLSELLIRKGLRR